MKNQILEKVKDAIRNPYAWPGGYPVYVVMADGELLCRDCACKHYRYIAYETNHPFSGGWESAGADILYEGTEYCGHCNCELESAYGEPEAE